MKVSKIFWQTLFLVAVVASAIYLARIASGNEVIQEIVLAYGYIGIFIVALISGFNLVVPIPAVSFLPLFIESGLSFWLTIFIIALGMTAADTLCYFFVRVGKVLASKSLGEKVFEKFHNLREKYYHYPLVILFVFASIVPLPNELLLIPAVILGYSFIQLIPIVLVGNFIFNLMFAKGLLNIFNSI